MNEIRENPLHIAAKLNDVKMLEILLQHGASIYGSLHVAI